MPLKSPWKQPVGITTKGKLCTFKVNATHSAAFNQSGASLQRNFVRQQNIHTHIYKISKKILNTTWKDAVVNEADMMEMLKNSVNIL